MNPAGLMTRDNSGVHQDPDNQSVPRQAELVTEQGREVRVTAAAWIGPLPPPDALQGYEDVIPGGAERIMAMAERQSAHRQEMERSAVIGASKRSYLGLGAGFLLSAITVGAGAFLIAMGHDLAGGSVIGINLN